MILHNLSFLRKMVPKSSPFSETSGETFHTAREEPPSTSVSLWSDDEVNDDKVEDDCGDSRLRTRPLMVLLLLVIEILAACGMALTAVWLHRFRGGLRLAGAFFFWRPDDDYDDDGDEPRHSLNVHSAAMAFCFVLCLPQLGAVAVCCCCPKVPAAEACVRALALASFVLGLAQVYSVESRHRLPPQLEGPDAGCHLILGWAAATFFILSNVRFELWILNDCLLSLAVQFKQCTVA